MHGVHSLRMGLNLPYKGLVILCARYMPLLKNAYRSHYETYKQISNTSTIRTADANASTLSAAASSE